MITNWGLIIRKYRQDKGLTQYELADMVGIKRPILSHYEMGKTQKMPKGLLNKFAAAFEISPAQLAQEVRRSNPADNNFGSTSNVSWPPMPVVKIPVIGVVPAGYLDLREEEASGYIYVPIEELKGLRGSDLRALRISGDSLTGDGINDKDYVVMAINQTEVIPGKIYIVRSKNGEVTAKHVYPEDDGMRLKASNPAYKDIVLDYVEILGRVVYSRCPSIEH